MIRLAANTGCALHLVEPLGFSMDDRLLRRAGLDYHEYAARAAPCRRGPRWLVRTCARPGALFRVHARAAQRRFGAVRWQPGDWLVFGSETSGCRRRCATRFAPAQRVRLPMRAGQRSLNLSNAVAVAVFEAWRQHGYAGAA